MQAFRIPFLAFVISGILVSNLYADLPAKVAVGGVELKLNGAGKRSKYLMSVYESGLYLREPNTDAEKVVEGDELMAIRVKITSSLVGREKLVASLEEGLEASTDGKTEAIARETEQFLECLQDEVAKDDMFDFVYVPNKGLFIMKNGKHKGTVEGLEFKQAFFGIWLSDKPVDKALKQAMLSGSKVR